MTTKREGQKQVNFFMPERTAYEGKIRAAQEGLSFTKYIISLIEKDVQENKNK